MSLPSWAIQIALGTTANTLAALLAHYFQFG